MLGLDNLIILLYHDLTKEDKLEQKDFDYQIYTIKEDKFEQQVKYLHNRGYRVLGLSDLLCTAEKEGISAEKSILITFDDGYFSNYSLAYPILQKYEFKATFFITVDWVGLPRYLSWEQIRETSNYGVEIGSHTLTHPNLTELNSDQIRLELQESKAILEDKLGKPANFLSIPGGDYNDIVKEIARETGYLGVCTSGWSSGNTHNDLYNLKRLGVKGYLSMDDFISQVEIRGKANLYRRTEIFLKPLAKRYLGMGRYRWLRDKLLGWKLGNED